MRFWKDPEAPLVDVYWYFTDLPFLPFPTVFNSRDWCEDPWHYSGLGEVFGAPRPYDGMEHVPGLRGGHVCGNEEDFFEGPEWPPTGPELVYGPDGIPTCCHRDPVAQVGTGSRPAAIVYGPPYPSRVRTGSRPGSQVAAIHNVSVRLSSASRSSALVTYTGPHLGAVLTGSRPAAHVVTLTVWSGSVTTGSQPSAIVTANVGTECNVRSGSRPAALYPPGECQPMWPRCTGAPASPWDTLCSADVDDRVSLWRRYPTAPGRNYRFQLICDPLAAFTWTLWEGDLCSGRVMLTSGSTSPPTLNFDFTASYTQCWFEMTSGPTAIGVAMMQLIVLP